MSIDNNNLQELQRDKLGYHFKDISLLKLALTHKSVGISNNERLEFLGDSILSFVISDCLFSKYEKMDEGTLTRMRASLVCKESLYLVARELNIDKYIILSGSEARSGGHQRKSILADAIESLIAAVFIDSGIEIAKEIVLRLFAGHIDNLSTDKKYQDPKTALQEYLQSFGKKLPQYTLIETKGPAHDQIFSVECTLLEINERFNAEGATRRKAEQESAKQALEYLKEERPFK